ncbi:hypothetical protein IEQ34_004595 [Dendrobium chrysotoxum]|uniref:Cytochrome b561 domain-containing protein n=1 Tax=Dendrobium chrysotoxum TaxID=161865 RepID=A0AAV7HHI8_DENCH|nr:hypothetical protein IEQ34_004595 [Dendrobium chrysotoxum]
MAVPVVRFPIVLAIRLMGFIAAALVISWAMHFRGGMALISDNKDLIFNVHPVLMVIGFVLLNGEALSLLSSWSGLLPPFVSLKLKCQLYGRLYLWIAGFATFWYPGGSKNNRSFLLPWHVFFGLYVYALALATVSTGILEKATFLQMNNVISRYSSEAFLVNSLGILLMVLGGTVVLAVIAPANVKSDGPRGGME